MKIRMKMGNHTRLTRPDLRNTSRARFCPDCATQLWYVENRSVIRAQVLGEALDLNRLEPLGRYEIQLDRKLERMLAMLLRLQSLR